MSFFVEQGHIMQVELELCNIKGGALETKYK